MSHQGASRLMFVLMCRDFNAIPDTSMEISTGNQVSPYRVMLQKFLSSSNLYDVWRCQNSTERDSQQTYLKIDLMLTGTFLLQQVVRSDIHSISWPDHTWIFMTVGGSCGMESYRMWHNDTHLMLHLNFQKAEVMTDWYTSRFHRPSRIVKQNPCPNISSKLTQARHELHTLLLNSHTILTWQ